MTSHLLKPIQHVNENSRTSEESEVFSLRDEDPLSLPSETLLNDNHVTMATNITTKEHKIQQHKSIVKSSAINLFWILTW